MKSYTEADIQRGLEELAAWSAQMRDKIPPEERDLPRDLEFDRAYVEMCLETGLNIAEMAREDIENPDDHTVLRCR